MYEYCDAIVYCSFGLGVLCVALLQFVRRWKFMTSPEMHAPGKSGRSPNTQLKTMIVLGTGGHTTEMCLLLHHLDRTKYNMLFYVYTDDFCRETASKLEEQHGNLGNCHFLWIARSRHVGQSWLSSVYTTALAVPRAVLHVIKHKPALLLCNGPGVCIPICVGAILLNLLWNHRCAIVFVESICRVKKLSLSGRLLQNIATVFIVQWPVPNRPPHAVCLTEESVSSQHVAPLFFSGNAASDSRHCLLTVGTTNFDRLIQTLDASVAEFSGALRRLGIETITIQIGGTATFVPEALQKLPNVRVVRTLPHIEFLGEVQKAALIIGHAGAGTILEALSSLKHLLIVPNRALMDDHQLELCEALAGRYCLSCPEEHVVPTLSNAVDLFRKIDCRLPPHLTTTTFVKRLNAMLRA